MEREHLSAMEVLFSGDSSLGNDSVWQEYEQWVAGMVGLGAATNSEQE